MRVSIMTIGSRGDVQPYVALGKGLKSAGHEVVFCTGSSFKDFVEGHGLGYAHMSNELVDLLTQDTGRKALEDMQDPLGAIKTAIRLFRMLKPIIRRMMQDCRDAALESEPDLIVYNSKVPGTHLAEKLGVPAVLAMPFPQFVATREFPTLGMPNVGFLNKASYKIVQLFASFYGGLINELRTKMLGLAKASRFAGLYHMADGTPVTVLHCYSEHVVPRPSDWPDCSHVTGYWFLDDDSEPSTELLEFLESGEPPIYVGFGSMSGRKPEKVTRVVLDSLHSAGVRGIIATGWGGLSASELPEGVISIDQAPHQWLFPRVAAVAHHGGAGTTAAGLRAGRPAIVCPFFGDQTFWGERVSALGVGSKPIRQRKLTVKRLTSAMREVTSDGTISRNAAELGRLIRAEDGIRNAVEIIERVASEV